MRYTLCLHASDAEPAIAELFLSQGGPVTAASARGETDIALTGSTESAFASLGQKPTKIEISLPESLVLHAEPSAIHISASAQLNVATSRTGASISGSIVSTAGGDGSTPLKDLLEAPHAAVGLSYGSWQSFSAVVALSGAEVRDESGAPVAVHFVAPPEAETAAIEAHTNLLNSYAEAAFAKRETLPYAPAKSLTKSVFRDPASPCGYSPLHDAVGCAAPLSLEAMDSLLEATLKDESSQEKEAYQRLLASTSSPGSTAAREARAICAAVGVAVSSLVSYRADGRACVDARRGAVFQETESWLRKAARSPTESNDCDGSAITAVSILSAAVRMTPDQEAKHKHLRAVKNAVHPHYQFGVAVVGATCAEASGGGHGEGGVAGHATCLVVPTLDVLRSLERNEVAKGGDSKAIGEARFNACYSDHVVQSLPDATERTNLTSWDAAKHEYTTLEAFAIEGPTPASPFLYKLNPAKRGAAQADSRLDDLAFKKIGPSLFRARRMLHCGGAPVGAPPDADDHRFYKHLVELTLPPTAALYRDTKVRALGAAASQFVFTPHTEANAPASEAGVTPKQVAMGNYRMAPLVDASADMLNGLDAVSAITQTNVIPPRARVAMKLDAMQSYGLRQSIAHLEALRGFLQDDNVDASMEADAAKASSFLTDTAAGVDHMAQFTVSFSTLLHNSCGVAHFCQQVKQKAVGGVVDIVPVVGLAVHGEGYGVGEDCGVFVSINACVEV